MGNATLLLRYSGFTILTDPAFTEAAAKAGLGDRVRVLPRGEVHPLA